MALHNLVALASLVAETLQVGDLNMATIVVDETKFLQAMGYTGNAGPLHAEHLREEFLHW